MSISIYLSIEIHINIYIYLHTYKCQNFAQTSSKHCSNTTKSSFILLWRLSKENNSHGCPQRQYVFIDRALFLSQYNKFLIVNKGFITDKMGSAIPVSKSDKNPFHSRWKHPQIANPKSQNFGLRNGRAPVVVWATMLKQSKSIASPPSTLNSKTPGGRKIDQNDTREISVEFRHWPRLFT